MRFLKIALTRSLFRNLGNHFPTAIILKGWDLVQEWSLNWFIYLIMKLKCRNLDSDFTLLFERKTNGLNTWFSALPGFCSAAVIWFLPLGAQLHEESTRNCSDLVHCNFMLILTKPISLLFLLDLSLTGSLTKYSEE